MTENIKNINNDPYRLKFHLMPPTGWLNDPNGLCDFNGKYHVFFQYSPDNPKGGAKYWGHYAGEDLIHLRFCGAPLSPDDPSDKNGVYSGSALTDNGEMLLYYTGNVKQPGEHDYTYSGREANTILVRSSDGEHFSPKQKLMSNKDYPPEYTCHVRDPKVWKQDGKYYMVQGGRLNGKNTDCGKDKGAVIVFAGDTPSDWKVIGNITTKEPFGFMWECPDYFEVDGIKIFSCSPQGLPAEEYRWQNIYQSGYFILPTDFDITAPKGNYRIIDDPENRFREWDMGFDFYAPQTFADSKGRRILIGWAGIPDADYDNRHTIDHNWQHALTVPRTINIKDGTIVQWPVSELEALRGGMRVTTEENETVEIPQRCADVIMENISCTGELLSLSDSSEKLFDIRLEEKEDFFVLKLKLSEAAGEGRKERRVRLGKLDSLRLLLDTSLLELYINDGEAVMTSRFYANEETAAEPFKLTIAHKGTMIYEMKEMDTQKNIQP